MTAQILEFKNRKKQASTSSEKPARSLQSNFELFVEAYEDVIGDWRSFAAKNRVNEFIASKLPPSAVIKNADYMNDLNVLVTIEQKLAMIVAVHTPGFGGDFQPGWQATFRLGKEMFSTPPDMASEANARALLLVLFIHFKAVLKSLGRDIFVN